MEGGKERREGGRRDNRMHSSTVTSAYSWYSCHGNSYLLWWYLRTSPVVEVVVKISVSDSKLQFLKKCFIVHHIQCIEYIKSQLREGRRGEGGREGKGGRSI